MNKKRYLLIEEKSFPSTLKNRFYSKVLLPNKHGCMLWIGSKHHHGYGIFVISTNKHIAAHRYSFELYNGVYLNKLYVCHSCDTVACVAPDHLFLGDQKANMQDRHNKKRGHYQTNEGISHFNKIRNSSIGEKNPKAKLCENDIKQIRFRFNSGESMLSIARSFKVCKSTINRIFKNKSWTHVI